MLINFKVKTLDAQTHELTIDNEVTVRELRSKVAEKTNIAPEQQRIIFRGQVLGDDTKQVKDYDIDGKVIHVVERPPGAEPQPAGSSSGGSGVSSGSSATEGAPRPTVIRRGMRNSLLVRALQVLAGGTGDTFSNAVQPGGRNPRTTTNPDAPTSSFCMNRIRVARHMLECANNIAAYLEDSSRGLNNTSLDILADLSNNPNFIDMVRGAIDAALQGNGNANAQGQLPTELESTPDSDVIPPSADSEIIPPSADSEVFTEDAIQLDSNSNGPPTVTCEQPPSNAAAAAGIENNASAAVNNLNAPGDDARGRAGTRVLAEVVGEWRAVQARLEPFIQLYHDLLQNDPSFEENYATGRESAQRLYDRVSEAIHYLSHAQHAISDLMLDVSQPAPRFLTCHPLYITQTGYFNHLTNSGNTARNSQQPQGHSAHVVQVANGARYVPYLAPDARPAITAVSNHSFHPTHQYSCPLHSPAPQRQRSRDPGPVEYPVYAPLSPNVPNTIQVISNSPLVGTEFPEQINAPNIVSNLQPGISNERMQAGGPATPASVIENTGQGHPLGGSLPNAASTRPCISVMNNHSVQIRRQYQYPQHPPAAPHRPGPVEYPVGPNIPNPQNPGNPQMQTIQVLSNFPLVGTEFPEQINAPNIVSNLQPGLSNERMQAGGPATPASVIENTGQGHPLGGSLPNAASTRPCISVMNNHSVQPRRQYHAPPRQRSREAWRLEYPVYEPVGPNIPQPHNLGNPEMQTIEVISNSPLVGTELPMQINVPNIVSDLQPGISNQRMQAGGPATAGNVIENTDQGHPLGGSLPNAASTRPRISVINNHSVQPRRYYPCPLHPPATPRQRSLEEWRAEYPRYEPAGPDIPNPQIQTMQVISSSPLDGTELPVQINAPNSPPGISNEGTQTGGPAAAGNGTENTGESHPLGGSLPNTASTGSTGATNQPRFNTATLPTTSTQTRSTSRPQVDLRSVPSLIPANVMFSFDRFLPCNSHHIRRPENGAPNSTNNAGGTTNIQLNIRDPSGRTFHASFGGNNTAYRNMPNFNDPYRGVRPHPIVRNSLAMSEQNAPRNLMALRQLAQSSSAGMPVSSATGLIDESSRHTLRMQLHHFAHEMLFSNGPMTPETTPAALERAMQWLNNEVLVYMPQYENPDYDSRSSAGYILRNNLRLILGCILDREQTPVQYETRLRSIFRCFMGSLYSVLFVCLGRDNAKMYWAQMMNLLIASLRSTFRGECLQFLSAFIDPNRPVYENIESIQECVVRRVRCIETPVEQTELGVETELPSSSTANNEEIVVSSAVPPSDVIDNGDIQLPTNVTDNGDIQLPTVEIGSNAWHEDVPDEWVPIIDHDLQAQNEVIPKRRTTESEADGPHSDAYISGMQPKRRKMLQTERPPPDVQTLISNTVLRVIEAEGGTSSTAPNESHTPEEVSEAIAADPAMQAACTEAIRTAAREHLKNNPDYQPEKYPNITNFIKDN